MGVGLDGRLSVSVIPAGCARAPGAPPAPARHRRRLPARLACRGEDVAPPNGRIAAKRHWTAPSCFVRQGQQGQPGPRGVRPGFSALQRAVPAHGQRGARPVPRVRAAVGGGRVRAALILTVVAATRTLEQGHICLGTVPEMRPRPGPVGLRGQLGRPRPPAPQWARRPAPAARPRGWRSCFLGCLPLRHASSPAASCPSSLCSSGEGLCAGRGGES